MLFEKQLHEQTQYSQVERATTRILKREQERIDEIMEIVFNFPSKNQFKLFDKREEEEEICPDSDDEDDIKIESSPDGKIILK